MYAWVALDALHTMPKYEAKSQSEVILGDFPGLIATAHEPPTELPPVPLSNLCTPGFSCPFLPRARTVRWLRQTAFENAESRPGVIYVVEVCRWFTQCKSGGVRAYQVVTTSKGPQAQETLHPYIQPQGPQTLQAVLHCSSIAEVYAQAQAQARHSAPCYAHIRPQAQQ